MGAREQAGAGDDPGNGSEAVAGCGGRGSWSAPISPTPVVGDGPRQSIAGAAEVLKASGIVPADADLAKTENELLEPRFTKQLAKN